MTTKRNFTAEEAQKKFDALPAEIKNLLYSSDMTSAIQKVGEKNKLHYDQMGVLEIETNNVMLGFTDTADYPDMLVRSLGVDKAAADAIAKDINETLFAKIRDSMKKMDTLPADKEPSVVMPSAAAKASLPATSTAPVPSTPPPAAAPKPVVPAAPAVPMVQTMHTADIMLSEPTVNMPPKPAVPITPVANSTAASSGAPAVSKPEIKVEAPKPVPPYKADPYREPPE